MRRGERPPAVAKLERRMLPLVRHADLAFWMRVDVQEVENELREAVAYVCAELDEPFGLPRDGEAF